MMLRRETPFPPVLFLLEKADDVCVPENLPYFAGIWQATSFDMVTPFFLKGTQPGNQPFRPTFSYSKAALKLQRDSASCWGLLGVLELRAENDGLCHKKSLPMTDPWDWYIYQHLVLFSMINM